MMCELAQSSHIKICLSSRPWNVFEEVFGRGPKLYMHDLTRNDIRAYVSDRLGEHKQWPSLYESTPTNCRWLVEEIVERCDGVFLWVFLVTKLLREGMTNRDRFSDLRRRLESFPRELELFFRQILDSVEPIYHAKTSSMLQVALTAKKPLHMIMYDFHDLEHDDEYYYCRRPIGPFSQAELSEVKSRMTYHLDSRTRGLLEVSHGSLEVTFLHRTVKDYLTSQGLPDFPSVNLPAGWGRKFIPELSILRAYAAWVRCATPYTLRRNRFGEYSDPGATRATDGITPSIVDLTTDLAPYAALLDSGYPRDPRLDEALDDIDGSVAALIARARTSAGVEGLEAWRERLFEDYGICPKEPEFKHAFAWATKVYFRERLSKEGVANYVASKESRDPAFGRFQTDEVSLGGDQVWWTLQVSFRCLRGVWEVYVALMRYPLSVLSPMALSFSLFLVVHLPSRLSRSFVFPFISMLAKYV